MAIDEVRIRLRQRLEEMLGVDEAAMLMDRPPGGWADLATKADLIALEHGLESHFDTKLDLKLEALEHKLVGLHHQTMSVLHQEIGAVQRELRAQTWRLLTAVLAAMSVLTAVFGLIVVVATR